MVQTKHEFLQMKPDDTVLLPVVGTVSGEKILDLKKNLNFLTLTFPDRSGKFALVLSSRSDEKLFFELGLNIEGSPSFKEVRIKDLFSMLMVNHISLIVDPFGEELILLSPAELCKYCIEHQEEIYAEKSFDSPAYVNYRVAKAKQGGPNEQRALLHDLVERGIFYVAASPLPPLSPNLSRIGKVDQRKHLMLFSTVSIAAQFCEYMNQKEHKSLVPVQLTMEQLRNMDEHNTGASMIYLNDGAEGLSFSFCDLREAFLK